MAADRHRRARNARDWTTDIPRPIIAHIFSLLPHRSALRLASIDHPLLMAFWDHLETLSRAAALDFGEEFAQGMPPDKYTSFVDGILQQRRHHAEAIHSLKIFFEAESPLHLRIVRDWLEIAASKNARVLELDLCMRVNRGWKAYPYWLEPLTMDSPAYSSWSSLTVLSVSRYRITTFLLPFELPSLQMLSLNEVYIVDEDVTKLLAGCPMLSALELVNCYNLEGLKFSRMPHLCRLTILGCEYLKDVVIRRLPVLKSIYYYGTWIDLQLKDVPALKDAYFSSGEQIHGASGSFLSNLTHVTNLTLCDAQLQEEIDLPLTFRNVKNLHVIFEWDDCLTFLCKLFCCCNFPVLENLFIEFAEKKWPYKLGPKEADFMNCTFACNELRLVSIEGFDWCIDHLEMVRFFLAKATILQTLVLQMSETETRRESKNKITSWTSWMMSHNALMGRNVKIQVCGAADPVALTPPPHAEFHMKVCRYSQRMAGSTHGP